MKLWAPGALLGAVVVMAAPAQAQVKLQTEVSAQKVQLGDSIELQLTVMSSSEDATLSTPKLSAPAGIEVRGPRSSSQTRVSIVNGRMNKSVGVTLTWALTPTRTGKFRIGPPSVEIAGRREQGQVVELEVLPAGSL
ncbi:MAG TPA: BatD family protein, partial [Polyangiaceae bacterium]|nr:BatD family protein [Polyangiaceae bacterium]